MTVESSVLKSVEYGDADRTLVVEFLYGAVYHYHDVPPEVANAFATAESKGQFFASNIRGKYGFILTNPEPTVQDDCPICGTLCVCREAKEMGL
jgi:hypothetical protein